MANPDFGVKYKAPRKEDLPFNAQVKVRLQEKTKQKLQALAKRDNCTATDIARKAIYRFLEEEEDKITA